MEPIIKTDHFFNESLAATLDHFTAQLKEIRKNEQPKRHAPLTSAAVKRAKVMLICLYLYSAKLDLTITSSSKIFKAILGRSVSQGNKAVFATPLRTAADKTEIDDAQIQALADLIKPKIAFLVEEMEGIKYKVATEHRKDKDKKVN